MTNRIKARVKQHRSYIRLMDWSKKTSLPGFHGVPMLNLVTILIREIKKDNVPTRANSIAYSFLISVFPTIIFLFTLLPYFPIHDFIGQLQDSMRGVLPKNAEAFIFHTINDIVSKPRAKLLSLNFFLALLFASNGMKALMDGFDKAYRPIGVKRNFFARQGIAFLLTFLLALILIASVVFVILGNQIITWVYGYVSTEFLMSFSAQLVKWVSIFSLFYLLIWLIFYFGPTRKMKLGFINPGVILGAVLMILASMGFSYFVNNFGAYNKIYGSIGTLIVVMIWLQINSFVLLLGFELNKSIALNKEYMYEIEFPATPS
ncbi:MAG: YihY/virulence factor BrkB family protein [Saprospiraceae bacterium]